MSLGDTGRRTTKYPNEHFNTAVITHMQRQAPSTEAATFAPSGGLLSSSTFAHTSKMKSESIDSNGIMSSNLTGEILFDLFETNATNLTFSQTTDFSTEFSVSIDCDLNHTSLCFSNISGHDEHQHRHMDHAYWSLFLLVFPVFTVFGNVLVVMSVYRERSLRTVTNYFICSLAFADILVAVIVMPPAVYMEVTKFWSLSDWLCDAWVAFDVMACTASILNLTAISVDRFIAVTQPIKYAKHKNSKRVYAMLVLTWVVSIAIAAPIALGVNYSPLRLPGDCSFFNSDFLIYSSMGSFYIPSLMMIFLYWRIYRVLRQRARQLAVKKRGRTVDTQTLTNVIENTATVQTMVVEKATVKTGLATMDNGKVSTYNTNETTESPDHADEHSTSNPPTNTDSQEKEDESDSKTPVKIEHVDHSKAELIINPVAHDMEARRIQTVEGVVTELGEMETNFSGASKSNPCKNNKAANNDKKTRKKEKKGVTKFNFHLRTSRKRKERSSSRREKKATKTLAIVLGVFLLCWWPFFTVNIMRAICIRYQVLNYPTCNIDDKLMGFFVWLGYINSFLNPLIYTIFNPEFRKAFKKILMERCRC